MFAFNTEAANLSTDASALVMTNTQNSLGSGVFIESNVVLTARHVVEGIVTQKLSVKDSTGVIHTVSKVITEKKPYAPLSNDYAFLIVSGAFSAPAKMSNSRIPQNTTMIGFLNEKAHPEESSKNQLVNGLLLHCSQTVHGYSGAPIYDANGEVVAIQNGVMFMKCFCPGMEYVSAATPIQKIIESAQTITPEIVPYLHPTL